MKTEKSGSTPHRIKISWGIVKRLSQQVLILLFLVRFQVPLPVLQYDRWAPIPAAAVKIAT